VLLAQITNACSLSQFATQNKDVFSVCESLAKTLGIVVAGIWAYMLFVRKREKFPRGCLSHSVQFWERNPNEWLVRVNLKVTNESSVLMRICEGHTWVQQMKPWPDSAIDNFKADSQNAETAPYETSWDLIGEKRHNKEREIEPGEHEEVAMDFFIDRGYEQILVYSFVENSAKPGRHLGWTTTTVLDFSNPPAEPTDQAQGQGTDKPRPANAKKTG
jgi:hypothetical protein